MRFDRAGSFIRDKESANKHTSGMKGYKSTCETHPLSGICFSCIVMLPFTILFYIKTNILFTKDRVSIKCI